MFHPRLGASPEKGPSGLTGDPLARFELLSPLFNANLKPGTGILAPVSGFRHRLESPVSSLAAAMAG